MDTLVNCTYDKATQDCVCQRFMLLVLKRFLNKSSEEVERLEEKAKERIILLQRSSQMEKVGEPLLELFYGQ
ncbi:unnamed protein product [Caretta caretta]